VERFRNDDRYVIKLDVFEGPLDLLLHLIRKHELDIFDIPMAFITSKYLEYLDLMKQINLDLAAEYLEMPATLTKPRPRSWRRGPCSVVILFQGARRKKSLRIGISRLRAFLH
jgi:hypothetical protein